MTPHKVARKINHSRPFRKAVKLAMKSLKQKKIYDGE